MYSLTAVNSADLLTIHVVMTVTAV